MAATTAMVAATAYGAYSANKQQKNAAKSLQTQSGPAYLDSASQNLVDRADQLSHRQYTPFQAERVAGLGANEQQAGRMASAFGDRTQAQMTGGFNPAALTAFQNPYIDKVLNNQRRVIGDEYGRQSANLAANQSATDAFRSGRSDLARSRLDESRMRALGDAEATGQAAAFDSSMNNYFNNERSMQSAFGTAQDALGRTGAAERSTRQAQNDFDYGQFLEKRDWDVNNLNPLLQAVQGARGGTTTSIGTTQQPGKDYWGAAAGVLGTAISQYAGSGSKTGSTGTPYYLARPQAGEVPAGQYNAQGATMSPPSNSSTPYYLARA